MKRYVWVLSIMGLLGALGICFFLYSQNNPGRRDAKLSKNENHLYAIAKKISIYYLRNGKLPINFQTLVNEGLLSEKDIKDDWNTQDNIIYTPLEGTNFKLRSPGPDKRFNPNGPILKVRDLSKFKFEDEIVTGDIEVTYSVVTVINPHVKVVWNQNSFYDW